jgi:hypothetical protein
LNINRHNIKPLTYTSFSMALLFDLWKLSYKKLNQNFFCIVKKLRFGSQWQNQSCVSEAFRTRLEALTAHYVPKHFGIWYIGQDKNTRACSQFHFYCIWRLVWSVGNCLWWDYLFIVTRRWFPYFRNISTHKHGSCQIYDGRKL